MRWILKRTMRNPPRAAVINGIITLNKQRLIRSLRILKVPPMSRIWLDGVRLAFAVRVDQCSGDEVTVGHGMGVCKGERISEDGFDGTPDLEQ